MCRDIFETFGGPPSQVARIMEQQEERDPLVVHVSTVAKRAESSKKQQQRRGDDEEVFMEDASSTSSESSASCPSPVSSFEGDGVAEPSGSPDREYKTLLKEYMESIGDRDRHLDGHVSGRDEDGRGAPSFFLAWLGM